MTAPSGRPPRDGGHASWIERTFAAVGAEGDKGRVGGEFSCAPCIGKGGSKRCARIQGSFDLRRRGRESKWRTPSVIIDNGLGCIRTTTSSRWRHSAANDHDPGEANRQRNRRPTPAPGTTDGMIQARPDVRFFECGRSHLCQTHELDKLGLTVHSAGRRNSWKPKGSDRGLHVNRRMTTCRTSTSKHCRSRTRSTSPS